MKRKTITLDEQRLRDLLSCLQCPDCPYAIECGETTRTGQTCDDFLISKIEVKK